MLAIAGGILLALLVIGMLFGGLSMFGEGENGCGCALLAVAGAIILIIIL